MCRQIYSKPALLLYSHNTFAFDNLWLPNIKLLPEQRDSVTSIQTLVGSLVEHASRKDGFVYRKKYVPTLKHVQVSTLSMWHVMQYMQFWGARKSVTEHGWRT